MAKLRTEIALDRTTLAWVRTALSLVTFGFGTIGFFRSVRQANPTPENVNMHQGAIRFGIALIVLGILSTVLAGVSHWLTLGRLRRDEAPSLTGWPLSIMVAMILAIIGSLSLWYVFPR
jgi:putative membrane protein